MSNGYQIDFLSFTLPKGHLPRAMKMLECFDLKAQEKGLYGYKFSYVAVGCRLLFSPERDDVHVQLTGRGCDKFDCLSLPSDARVSRLDIAFDSYDGAYTVEDVWGCLLQGRTAGLSRSISGFVGFAGKNAGRTIYVGSPKSNTRLRIYDKAAEQGITKEQRIDYKDWTRYELQLRSEIAQATYKKIRLFQTLPDADLMCNLASVFAPILDKMFMICGEKQINYSEQLNHHYTRIPAADWSAMFCRYNHARPAVVHRAPTLSNLSRYVLGAAASFKALSVVFPDFEHVFTEKVQISTFSEKHEELLLDFAPAHIHGLAEAIFHFELPF